MALCLARIASVGLVGTSEGLIVASVAGSDERFYPLVGARQGKESFAPPIPLQCGCAGFVLVL